MVEAALSRTRLVNRLKARLLKEIPFPVNRDSRHEKKQMGAWMVCIITPDTRGPKAGFASSCKKRDREYLLESIYLKLLPIKRRKDAYD